MVNSNFSPQDKKPGDLILSADWNAAMSEIKRLEKLKLNREGADTFKGTLTIQEALNVTGDVRISGNITVNNTVFLKGSATTTGLSVNTSGNVGIGTTTPTERLDVNGNIKATNANFGGTLAVTGNSTLSRIRLESGVIQRGGNNITDTDDLGLYSQESGVWMRFVTNNAPIHFFTENGTNGIGSNTRMVISSDGNVGIGTTTPTERLDVNGKLKINGGLIIGKTEITEDELEVLKKLANSKLTVAIESQSEYYLTDNHGNRIKS